MMDIITLLKANIRKKKGTFISIMLLTAIIVSAVSSIFSVRINYTEAIDNAFEYADCGEVTAFIHTEKLTDELCSSMENSEYAERVDYTQCICTNGSETGDTTDGNSYFMMELPEKVRLFNEKADSYEENVPALEKGEIYLPYGLCSKLGCNTGDKIKLWLIFGESAEFTIKGFVQEPVQGSMTIGWKQVFISHEDYEEIYNRCKPLETEDVLLEFTKISVHQAESSELSAAKFQRLFNQETHIIDYATGALNNDQSIRYSTLLPDIVTNIVVVFMVFLFVIVLVVMSHSIGTEIEIDYVSLGVLKSQGFPESRLRAVIMLQYLFAELAGIILGSIAALPIERAVSGLCMSVTAVLPEKGISAGVSIIITLIIMAVSAVIVFSKTRKVGKISPVRAISGGREEIYFDSRLNAPVSGKALMTTLSLRQLTSAKKRYIGTIFIVALLTFSMITVNLTGNLLTSRSALEAMGLIIPDIDISYNDPDDTLDWDEVDSFIADNAEIEEVNSMNTGYVSLNGENLYCMVFDDPEGITGVLRGREPIYDNELVITDMVAELLDVKMGDEVTVSKQDKEAEYIISGIFQSGNDSGMSFAMGADAYERMTGEETEIYYRYYMLKDKSVKAEISELLNEKYGEELSIHVYDDSDNPVLNEYGTIVDALKLIIYAFSVIFAFVVVRMVCAKTFLQERKDIGIYKAVGFTAGKLRLGFAIRFFILGVTGSVLGAVLSVLFSGKMLGAALSLIGLTKIVLTFTAGSVIIPAAVISICFFLFAYITAGRIKRVQARELITE